MLAKRLTFAMLICSVAVGADVPKTGPLVDDTALQNAGLTRFWAANLPLPVNDRVVEGYLVDEALYVVTDNGSVFALEAGAGLIRWADKLTEADYAIHRPAHLGTADGNGPVVIPTTTRTFVYDRFSGERLMQFRPEFAVGGPAVGSTNLLFVGGSDGRLHALRLNDRRARKPYGVWDVLTGGPISASPVLYDRDQLLFASQDGAVYSCRATDKSLNWRFRTLGPIFGDPAVDRTAAYVASSDRSVYKIELATGLSAWRFRMPRPLTEGPIVTAQGVYQFCLDSGLSRLDTESGEEVWRIADARRFVASSGASDALFTLDQKLLLVDHKTGEIKHEIAAPVATVAVTNTRDDAIYLLGHDGRVLCARPDHRPYLRRQQVMAARARLNRPPANQAAVTGDDAKKKHAPKPDPLAKDPFRSRRDLKP